MLIQTFWSFLHDKNKLFFLKAGGCLELNINSISYGRGCVCVCECVCMGVYNCVCEKISPYQKSENSSLSKVTQPHLIYIIFVESNKDICKEIELKNLIFDRMTNIFDIFEIPKKFLRFKFSWPFWKFFEFFSWF